MDQSRRSSFTFGVILVILGAFFLAVQLVPQLKEWISWENAWPLIVVGVGTALMIGAIVGRTPGLAASAVIVGGIGCLLWWQNATDNWSSWAYAWALIPGFVGVGTIVSGLLSGHIRSALTGGGWLIVISLVPSSSSSVHS